MRMPPLRGIFAAVLTLLFVAGQPAHAQTQAFEVDCDSAALVAAIDEANDSPEAATLNLTAECVYSFTTPADVSTETGDSALPKITTPVTIIGNGAVIERADDSPDFRLFFVTSTGNLTLDNVTVRGGGNGGIVNHYGTVNLIRSIVSGNSAFQGGGVSSNGALSVINSTVTGNSAANSGGGIHNSGTLWVINSVISGNRAEREGGGILNYFYSNATILSSTVSGNSASEGGGIYNYDGWVDVTNGILWGNSSQIYNDTGTVNVYSSIVEKGYEGYGNLDSDPLFVDPVSFADAPATDGDYHLLPGSSAIDAINTVQYAAHFDDFDLDADGDTAEDLPYDRDGNPRVANGKVDLGAYEAVEQEEQ